MEVISAPGLFRASVTVWAPTPQPASKMVLPAGYTVSECSSCTSVEAWSCNRVFSRGSYPCT